jgi:hypothetical protein
MAGGAGLSSIGSRAGGKSIPISIGMTVDERSSSFNSAFAFYRVGF